jgi:A/G-specific adenine glycosylase
MHTNSHSWIDHHLDSAVQMLMEHGLAVGHFMPWHHSRDPYHWLVAEALLRRTTRTAAHKAYLAMIDSYPTWGALVAAQEAEIVPRIAWVGLGNQRSRQLKALAQTIVDDFGGVTPQAREDLLELPGVGPYIADVLLLYVFGQRAFPLDPNVQRVFRRLMGLPVSKGTRRSSRYSDPYRDPWIQKAVHFLLQSRTAVELREIHRGVLHIAWTTCRSQPDCGTCPIREVCQYAVGQNSQPPPTS